MRKFAFPFLLALICVAMLTAPAFAEPQAASLPLPAGTASPRDWDKLTSNGELLGSAVKGDSAILIDAKTGKVLFEKDADTKRYPASTTKIMTCLVALESKKSLSSIVTVGALPKLPGDASIINLKKGEVMTLEDLLYGLMLMSGNDAANAIAAYIGDGSIDNFVGLMNAKAQELGMTGTHYVNTNGLHDADHYTTARDMATLARAAQSFPEFVRIVSTYKYTVSATNMHPDLRVWLNHDRLINPADTFGYKYATGVKTGFTNEAEQTFVGSAQKDSVSLIAIDMHAAQQDDKWTDSITMFEYGFNFYDTIDLVQLLASNPITTDVKNAAASDQDQGKLQLSLVPKTPNAFITDTKDVINQLKSDPSQFVPTLNITKDSAPIKKNETVGTVTFSYNGSTVLECDLIASRDVAEMPTTAPTASSAATVSKAPGVVTGGSSTMKPGGTQAPQQKQGINSATLIWTGVIILLLLAALVSIRIVNMSRRNKKYHQYNYRSGSTRLKR